VIRATSGKRALTRLYDTLLVRYMNARLTVYVVCAMPYLCQPLGRTKLLIYGKVGAATTYRIFIFVFLFLGRSAHSLTESQMLYGLRLAFRALIN